MNNTSHRFAILFLFSSFILHPSSFLLAQPPLIPYQGRLVDGTNLVNAVVGLRLSLWSTETGGMFPLYADSNTVTVTDGLYNTFIGDDTTFGNLATALQSGTSLWVEVTVDGVTLTPRERVGSVPYALVADGVRVGGVTTLMLADGSVTSNKLATGSVQPDDLAKPYQSGRIALTNYPFHATATITQAFASVFAAAPVVTLGLDSASDPMLDETAVGLRGVGTGSFIARVAFPPAKPSAVETGVAVGFSASLALVGANPAVAHVKEFSIDRHLRYTRALNSSGTVWGATVGLETGLSRSVYAPSLAVVNGRPAISFYDHDAREIRYMRAGDATGSAWPSSLTIVAGVTNRTRDRARTVLMVVNGNPAIVYSDLRNDIGVTQTNRIGFVRANDSNGTTWGAPVILAISNSVDGFPHLEIVNGNPAVTYVDSGGLKYLRASDASGSAWPATPITITPLTDPLNPATLAVINGRPAVALVGRTNLLHYVRSSDSSGTSWPALTTLGTNYLAIETIRLVAVAGTPAIAVANGVGRTTVIKAFDANGAAWGTAGVVTGAYETAMGYVYGEAVLAFRGNQQATYLRDPVQPAALNWIAVQP